jgi:CubicO group peptidase (beta-lactamase class C family)
MKAMLTRVASAARMKSRTAVLRTKKPVTVMKVAAAAVIASAGAFLAIGQPVQTARPVVTTVPAAAQSTARPLTQSNAEIAKFFDDYMARTIKELAIPGGAIIVVRNGDPILEKGFGYADVASKRSVSVNDSLFPAASISKLIPWLLVMQLVEDGRLDLDRDVNDYLDFAIPKAFGKPITMRHLMTHTAGFPEHFHGAFEPELTMPLGEMLRRNIPERVYAPGSTIAYSNHGAALAGYIAERLRRKPWHQLVAERIFEPAAMMNSTFAQPPPAPLRERLVSTYTYGSSDRGEYRTTSLPPMGALATSPSDMGRLLTIISNGGQGSNGSIVSARTLQHMMALQKPLGPGLKDGLGLGFFVGEYRGVRYAGHGGNMSTLATDLEVLPDHGLAWYYVFNSQGPGEYARKVRDDLLRKAIAEFAAPQVPSLRARGPSSARDVAGTYISTRRMHYGPLMFSGLANTTEVAAGPEGTINIESSGTSTTWLPAGPDRFVEAETGIPLAATRGSNGKIERIGSALLYPAAEFQRRPAYVELLFYLAAFSFATLLLAFITAPIAALLRRRRARASDGASSIGHVTPYKAAQVHRWAKISFRLLMLTIFAWAVFGLLIALDFSLLFSIPALVRIILATLTLFSLQFALTLVWDAVLAFRDPAHGWFSRSWGIVCAAAGLGLATVFYAFDVINFSTNW